MKTKKKDNQDSPGTDPVTTQNQEPTIDETCAEESPLTPQAEIASLKDALLRAKADFANLQRRATVERAEAIRFANADLLKSLLGVLDDFDRTIEASGTCEVSEAGDKLKSIVDGIQLVHANLAKALQGSGLEEINALHETFDPTIHEALLQQPSDDEHAPGTVVEQVAKGYRLRDRVLRPAKVIVAEATGENLQE